MTETVLVVALCYAGLCGFCLAVARHGRRCWGRPPSRGRALALRLGGSVALVIAFAVAVASWGAGEGTVAVFVAAGLAGSLLVPLLAYRPKPAAVLGLLLPGLAIAIHLFAA